MLLLRPSIRIPHLFLKQASRPIHSATMATAAAPIHKEGTADGWHGVITPGGEFPPEKGRYHLYIGIRPSSPNPYRPLTYAPGFFCPFAHRANLVRHLKGLTDFISLSVVKPYPKGDDKGWPGWKFPANESEYEGATVDALFGSEYMHEIYFKADKEYKGRYSVPVLWDTKSGTIVCNVGGRALEPSMLRS